MEATANVTTASTEKPSPAELKKRAKAEKQARRAAQKGEAEGESAATPALVPDGSQPAEIPAQSSKQVKQQLTGQSKKAAGQTTAEQAGPLAIRRRPSWSAGSAEKTATRPKRKDEKHVELFSHLYSQPRRRAQEAIPRDVHPMVVSVGLQMSDYSLCGSSARCVAMLVAFKHAIQAYSTPSGTSLARHLVSHYLSPQIDFLKSCRPLSESMGNAIRFLKKRIVEIDPSIDDETAKAGLCEDIDIFVRERIHITGHAIAETASKQIKDGAVVLVYAKSTLVEKTVLHALRSGTQFRVIVADSRPLFEGRSLARSLMRSGVQVDYMPLSAVAHAVKEASIVMLGAHSMLSNGRLQSRIGTAMVAMSAYRAGLPVIVCCESLKFSGKVALDSIVSNELASSDEITRLATATRQWREIDNLQALNLMYDVTPAEYIRMVICEYGSLPSSSVPVVHRLANEGI